MESPYEKYFAGFKAAVPLAFRDALGACLFSIGDVLYDSKDGYLPWKEAVAKLSWSIQVIQCAPAVSQQTDDLGGEDDDSADAFGSLLFEKNWFAPITIRFTNYRTTEVAEIVSTQGKLYTVLWKGDPTILSAKNDPPVPITVAKATKFNEQAKVLLGADDPTSASWVMAYDPTNVVTISKRTGIKEHLAKSELKAVETSIQSIGISEAIAPTVEFLKLSIETKKIEVFRDAIIEVLWPKRSKPLNKTVGSIFEKSKTRTARGFSLARHGIFFPKPRGLYDGKDIWIRSFSHVTNYRYRLHCVKAKRAPDALFKFLESIFDSTPNFLFSKSLHASKLAFSHKKRAEPLRDHPLMGLANLSEAVKLAKQRHESLQMYLMEHCENTFACEIPLWVEATEFKDYAEIFGSPLPLTGHIDFLRFEEDGRIGIWDYKPAAAYETSAFYQLSLYAFMLATRTGMPVSAFICGYFDEAYAFSFKPEEHPLSKIVW